MATKQDVDKEDTDLEVAERLAERGPGSLPKADLALLNKVLAGLRELREEKIPQKELAVIGYLFECTLARPRLLSLSINSGGLMTGCVDEPANPSVLMGTSADLALWLGYIIADAELSLAETERFGEMLRERIHGFSSQPVRGPGE